MTIIQALILGLVQGLTEFLPVSSSGHLQLLSTIFGINDSDMFFSIMVHFATLIAVIIVMRKDLLAILKKPFGKMTWLLVAATVPIILAALFLNDLIGAAFSGRFLGFAFLITGFILTASEIISSSANAKRKSSMGFGSAAVMGVMQAVAIVPGISRSGSTISGGLFSGLDRKLAARFAFLMSIPAILGSVVLECVDALKPGGTAFADVAWLPTLLGMAAAFVSGFFAIRFMLALISKKRLYGFAIYTFALGAIVLLDQLVFNVFFSSPF